MKNKFLTTATLLLSCLFASAQNLIISEIHYNPRNEGTILSDDLEFIELTNIGTTTINLTGYSFVSGITYVFGSNSSISAGASLILAKNKTVFDSFTKKTAYGQYSGSLKNSGETVRFTDAVLNTVFEVTYSDISPWPVLADGVGYSLELVDPTLPNEAKSWVASQNIGGSPGTYSKTQTALQYSIKVNEILANTTGNNPDKIEIFNYGTTNVNIGYWYLTDDKKDPKKYQIPANTTINAGEYKVFSSIEFGTKFSLSSKGEEAYIFSADANGLTGYSHGFDFSVSDIDQSYGLHTTSQNKVEKFNLTTPTFGSKNSAPAVGPLVITDIMYNPDILTDEFLIIKNISNKTVSSNSTELPDSNGIKITAIDYKFDYTKPVNFEPNESFIFTSIAPSEFRSKYNVKAEVKIFQYMIKTLSNSNELIEIKVPIYRDTLANKSYDNHYKTIDEVHYYDSEPWPVAADGNGAYLRRTNNKVYANDPAIWIAVTYPVLNTYKILESKNLTIYPSIANNTISVESSIDYDSYQIMNDLGQVITSGNYNSTIDVSTLKEGLYFLVLANKESVNSSKFIKQ